MIKSRVRSFLIDTFSIIVSKYCKADSILLFFAQQFYWTFFSYPKTVQLHINSDCNLACEYCYSIHNKSNPIKWINILKQAQKMGVHEIHFSGGEPFLDPNLKEYLNYCSHNKIDVVIFTNGLLVDAQWIQDISSLTNKLTFAFKFDHASLLEEVTGTGNYNKIIEVIKKCLRAGIKVHTHTIVTKKNYNKILEIIEIVKEVGAYPIFERYMKIGKNEIDKAYALKKEEWNIALDAIKKRQLNRDGLIRSFIKGNSCSCYIELLSIDIDGNVKPCPYASKEQSVGNIRHSSLKHVWENFKKERKEWLKLPPECKRCNQRYTCHGGCRTHSYYETKKYSVMDPLCNQKKIPLPLFIKR